MTNHIDKSVIDLLKKMQEKHPEDKDLQDYLQFVLGPDDDPTEADESSYILRIVISCETMDTVRKFMHNGVNDPVIIHKQTGIPMEALAVIGIKVPVHDYVIPVKYASSKMEIDDKLASLYATCGHENVPKAYMLTGLVSVKAVSPEDALATLESHIDDVHLPEILPNTISTREQSFDEDPYVEIMDGTDTIERLTELAENGFIGNVVDSGLVSPVVKHQGK